MQAVAIPITDRWDLFQVGIFPEWIIGIPTEAGLRLGENPLLYNMENSEPQLAKYFELFLGMGAPLWPSWASAISESWLEYVFGNICISRRIISSA